MYMKPILSLAALAGASANDAVRDVPEEIERSLQGLPASATCFIAQQADPAAAALKCCPCADPDDGICSILWCMNLEPDLSLKEAGTCDCGQIRDGCAELEPLFPMIATMVQGLQEICKEVVTCCPEAGATTDEFNGCLSAAQEAGKIATPDLSLLGGIPVFEGDGACEEGAAGDGAEDPAGSVATDTAPTEAAETTTTTEAPADAGATEAPAGGGGGDETDGEPDSYASKKDISALASLVGSSLAILMA